MYKCKWHARMYGAFMIWWVSIYLSIRLRIHITYASESQMKLLHHDINNINISKATAAAAAIESFVYLYIRSLTELRFFPSIFPFQTPPSKLSQSLFSHPTSFFLDFREGKNVNKFPSLLCMKFQLSPFWHIRNIQWAIISRHWWKKSGKKKKKKEKIPRKREREVQPSNFPFSILAIARSFRKKLSSEREKIKPAYTQNVQMNWLTLAYALWTKWNKQTKRERKKTDNNFSMCHSKFFINFFYKMCATAAEAMAMAMAKATALVVMVNGGKWTKITLTTPEFYFFFFSPHLHN